MLTRLVRPIQTQKGYLLSYIYIVYYILHHIEFLALILNDCNRTNQPETNISDAYICVELFERNKILKLTLLSVYINTQTVSNKFQSQFKEKKKERNVGILNNDIKIS